MIARRAIIRSENMHPLADTSPIAHLEPLFKALDQALIKVQSAASKEHLGNALDDLMSAVSLATSHSREDMSKHGLGNSIYCCEKLTSISVNSRRIESIFRKPNLDCKAVAEACELCRQAMGSFLRTYSSMRTG